MATTVQYLERKLHPLQLVFTHDLCPGRIRIRIEILVFVRKENRRTSRNPGAGARTNNKHNPHMGPWGPFLERPGNLPGPESDFDIKVSRKVGRVLTSDGVHVVFLADKFTVQFSNFLKLPLECKTKQLNGPGNRPFAGSGHMVRNKLHWDANDAVGLSKQRNSYQSSVTLLCFESPTASFASQCNLFRTM